MQSLTHEVRAHLDSMDYDTVADAAQDVITHGCASGVVPGLIYYDDTVAFYKRHKAEINKLLSGLIDDTGLHFYEILSDWDKDDTLALETHNQNLLAWFGFEETARRFVEE